MEDSSPEGQSTGKGGPSRLPSKPGLSVLPVTRVGCGMSACCYCVQSK